MKREEWEANDSLAAEGKEENLGWHAKASRLKGCQLVEADLATRRHVEPQGACSRDMPARRRKGDRGKKSLFATLWHATPD